MEFSYFTIMLHCRLANKIQEDPLKSDFTIDLKHEVRMGFLCLHCEDVSVCVVMIVIVMMLWTLSTLSVCDVTCLL